MSWIESVVYLGGFPSGTPPESLLKRMNARPKVHFKAKSDFVKFPIPENGLEGLWKRLLEEDYAGIIFTPYGGRVSLISESEIPFPHRNGTMFMAHYSSVWGVWGDAEHGTELKHLDWSRKVYTYMAPYVSQSPREVYVNYRDLDLGINKKSNTTFEEESVWGNKYFKHNFKKLVKVKTKADPLNFFRHEQSIPPLINK